MQGLLRRLADLDSDAERGVRVIEFFDQLVVHGADLEAIVRASAVLAEGTAGATNEQLGVTCVIAADGSVRGDVEPAANALVREIRIDGTRMGRAWLQRADGEREWDELIVDRMALTVAATYSRARGSERGREADQLGLSDPAIIQKLLDFRASDVERSRAIRLLGFAPAHTVDLLALHTSGDIQTAVSDVVGELQDRHGRHAVGTVISDGLGVILAATSGEPFPVLDPAITGCIAERTALECVSAAWPQVRQGVRFASLGDPWPRVVRLRDLGSLVLLADISRSAIVQNDDVRALQEIAGRPSGSIDLKLLRAVCTSNSIRECANVVHMHHSSVTYRLNRLSQHFGFDLRSGVNRYRLSTALLLWGLSSPLDGPSLS